MKFLDIKDRKYVEGIGRRKESSARVRLYKAKKGEDTMIFVNNRDAKDFFSDSELEYITLPLNVTESLAKWHISVQVKGGGHTGWKDAIRLGIARALVTEDEKHRPTLRKNGFLTRDPRAVERKKAGLKKARKAPRWSKR